MVDSRPKHGRWSDVGRTDQRRQTTTDARRIQREANADDLVDNGRQSDAERTMLRCLDGRHSDGRPSTHMDVERSETIDGTAPRPSGDSEERPFEC
jgi:hypothetical protein